MVSIGHIKTEQCFSYQQEELEYGHSPTRKPNGRIYVKSKSPYHDEDSWLPYAQLGPNRWYCVRCEGLDNYHRFGGFIDNVFYVPKIHKKCPSLPRMFIDKDKLWTVASHEERIMLDFGRALRPITNKEYVINHKRMLVKRFNNPMEVRVYNLISQTIARCNKCVVSLLPPGKNNVIAVFLNGTWNVPRYHNCQPVSYEKAMSIKPRERRSDPNEFLKAITPEVTRIGPRKEPMDRSDMLPPPKKLRKIDVSKFEDASFDNSGDFDSFIDLKNACKPSNEVAVSLAGNSSFVPIELSALHLDLELSSSDESDAENELKSDNNQNQASEEKPLVADDLYMGPLNHDNSNTVASDSAFSSSLSIVDNGNRPACDGEAVAPTFQSHPNSSSLRKLAIKLETPSPEKY